MGGTGSGRWTYHDTRLTVEECAAISITDVARVLSLGKSTRTDSGLLRPTRPTKGRIMDTVRCTLEADKNGDPLLKLTYTVPGRWASKRQVQQSIILRSTRPHFGGCRWWLSCKGCGRRVGKLYRPPEERPPEERYFACRHCLNLTYQSSQQSHKYDRLCRLMAGEDSGELVRVVKEAVYYQTRASRTRRATPSPKLSDAFHKVFGEAEGQQDTLNLRCDGLPWDGL